MKGRRHMYRQLGYILYSLISESYGIEGGDVKNPRTRNIELENILTPWFLIYSYKTLQKFYYD